MSAQDHDPLFNAYINELAYLRIAGAEFGRAHPKLARRLELGREGSADPHVQRLIESFAFLTARIQRELDADFPLIPSSLLGVLYPHLTAPVPSMAVARFNTDPEHSRSTMGIVAPRGTQLFAAAEDGLTCRFRTCYPVTLWPIQTSAVEILQPFALAGLADTAEQNKCAALLRVRLRCLGKRDFSEMRPDSLRFFIDADHSTTEALYEVLLNQVRDIRVVSQDGETVRGGDIRVSAVGFAADEAVLPHPENAHQGYRLLQEYFLFPEKYLFIDVFGLPELGPGKAVDLVFMLSQRPPAGMILDDDTLLLGCTPMINLFPRTSEPIRTDGTQTEYRLNPDMRWERATEIHTIVKVSDTAAADSADRSVLPFFSVSHDPGQGVNDCYWTSRRAPTGRADMPGTDIFLSFKDMGLSAADPGSAVLFAHTLCTNRGAAEQIPAGAELQLEYGAPTASIVCQTRPTPQIAPPEDGETLWRLVSHLSVNHLSLGGDDGLRALKEILRLYGGLQGGHGQQIIDSLQSMSTRRIMRRVGSDAWRGFCRGTEITLAVDDRNLGSGLYLFTAVLSRFLGLYCGVNMFTQLAVTSRRHDGVWISWPPMSGEALVL